MKKKLIMLMGLVLIMCLLVPVSCAKAPMPAPGPPTPPEPSFSIPDWARNTLIGLGGLALFGIGYFMGRRSALYY